MRMDAPLGNDAYGPTLVRIALGSYFVIAGMAKMDHIPQFVEFILQTNVLNQYMARLYGNLLPYFEIVAGGLLVIGFWTTLAAMLTTLMLTSFIMAMGVFPHSPTPFGTEKLFNKDIILWCASASLLYTGAGAFSIDKFRKG